MLDRELLGLAAKAAGYTFDWGIQPLILATPPDIERPWRCWNPLTDDADALRLAVKLDIHVLRFENMTAATRRAIVRAAAEIGKTK